MRQLNVLLAGVLLAVPAISTRPASATPIRQEHSVDDGATWREASVSTLAAGRFQVTVPHPALASTNGFVTLRTTTNDSVGGSVTQLVRRAYALR